jgi:MFS family permease/rhodanese-related sulfurtransferase
LTRRYHLPSALRPSSFRIEAPAARELIQGGALLVDVRRQYDPSSPLERARRIPPDEIPASVDALPRGVPIVLACACMREATSVRVAYFLRDRGFEAYAVRGGVLELLGRARAAATGADGAGRGRRARLTLGALRDKRFRRFAAGVLVNQVGSWVEWAAFGYVALLLGGTVAALGVIGFLSTIPGLVLGLPAGPLTDRFDPRKLVLVLQSANMAVSMLLAVLFATGSLTVAEMGVLAVLGGSLGTLAFPAFHAMLATTVPREHLESAVAINSLVLQCARFIGPAIAGVLLATAGPTWVFGVNAASFLGVIVAVALLPAPGIREAQAREALGHAIRTGLRYVMGSRSISSLLALTVLTGLFAVPPIQFMLPALVRFTLHRGPGTLGALTSVIGLGSLLGAALLLCLSARPNKGEPILYSFILSALALIVVGLSKSGALWVALAVTGLTRTVLSGLSTVTLVAASTEEMRARALAIWAVASAGVVPLGGLLTAGLASWLGVGGAVLVDGIALGLGGLLILARRPEARWLGCTTLPVACLAGIDPDAVAEQTARRERRLVSSAPNRSPARTSALRSAAAHRPPRPEEAARAEAGSGLRS